jgi:hypothetical protein
MMKSPPPPPFSTSGFAPETFPVPFAALSPMMKSPSGPPTSLSFAAPETFWAPLEELLSPTRLSAPAPPSSRSLPRPPQTVSSPPFPRTRSLPPPAKITSFPDVPLIVLSPLPLTMVAGWLRQNLAGAAPAERAARTPIAARVAAAAAEPSASSRHRLWPRTKLI